MTVHPPSRELVREKLRELLGGREIDELTYEQAVGVIAVIEEYDTLDPPELREAIRRLIETT